MSERDFCKTEKGAWDKDEERKLIDAAYDYKLGNWPDMIKMMNTSRCKEECAAHFDTEFVSGPIGRFARNDDIWHRQKKQWLENLRKKHLSNGKDEGLPINDDFEFSFYLAALRWKKSITLSPDSENLEEEIRKIAMEYAEFTEDVGSRGLDADRLEMGFWLDDTIPKPVKCNRKLKADDPLDPSDDEKDEDETSHVAKATSKRIDSNPYSRMEDGRDATDITRSESSCLHCDITLGDKVGAHLQKLNASLDCDICAAKREHSGLPKRAPLFLPMTGQTGNRKPDLEKISETPAVRNRVSPTFTSRAELAKALSAEAPRAGDLSSSQSVNEATGNQPVYKIPLCRWNEMMAYLRSGRAELAEAIRRGEKTICPEILEKLRRSGDPALSLFSTEPRAEMPDFRKEDLDALEFNPQRNQFEMEHYNEAERLVSGLSISSLPAVNNEMVNLGNNAKFARIEQYKRAIMARNAVKNAVLEHDMMSGFSNFQKTMEKENKKKKSKRRTATEVLEQRPPKEKLFVGMQQSLTKKQLNELKEKHENFEALKARIEQLQALQKKGITSLAGTKFDKNKKEVGQAPQPMSASLRAKSVRIRMRTAPMLPSSTKE